MDARRLALAFALTLAPALLLAGCDSYSLGPLEPPPPELEPDPNAGPPVIAFVSTRSGSPYIYVATADGTGVRRLARGEAPSWSWDGRRIAFGRGSSLLGPAGIYVMDANGENVRYVGSGSNPAWSPDGKIAFSTTDWPGPEGGIAVMNADGTGARLLIGHSFATESGSVPDQGIWSGSVGDPSWSPDGLKVTFLVYPGYYYEGETRVYVVDADGSDPRNLGNWSGRGPSWSPDGTTLAGAHGTIVLHDLALGTETVLDLALPGTWVLEGGTAWSPDGRQLLVHAYDQSAVWHPSYGLPKRVFAVSLETGQVRSFFPEATNPALSNYHDYDATWSRGPR